jgi:hypothetical protein
MLVRLEKANDGKYKWIAHFSDGSKTRFGAVGYEDYTQHKDSERRRLYRLRHAKDLKTNDPKRAGFLARFVLWGDSTDINENIRLYNQRFFRA